MRFTILILLLLSPTQGVFAAASRFDLLVSRDAVYAVEFEALAQHGLRPQRASRLRLESAGDPVPFWIDGPRRDHFGPGSRLMFVGQHLRGDAGRFDEYTMHNVYRLSAGEGGGVQGRELAPLPDSAPAGVARVVRELEQDRIRVRFSPHQVESGAEIWYWRRLSVLDPEPFTLPIDLGAIGSKREVGVRLRIGLRGWSFSHVPLNVPDHRVEVLLNGHQVAAAEWDSQAHVVIETDRIPSRYLRDGENQLQLRVPSRRTAADDALVVDVSLLNWVEIEHAFDGRIEAGQMAMQPAAGRAIELSAPSDLPLALYSTRGERVRVASGATRIGADFDADRQPERLILLAGDAERPDEIRPDRPSDLRRTSRRADYLMIAHGSLLEAARPLADFHAGRGLEVALIDVQDIYDEFNHGVLSPHAIHDFIAYARSHWRSPAPRFVLLVGDASWENHGGAVEDVDYADWTFQEREGQLGRFVKNGSTPYAEPGRSRNLVPTLQAMTFEGQAASDSELVNIEGDDIYPDLAIGRLPVSTPDEVDAIVRKLIEYETRAPVGPWRRSMLWISNDEDYMQRTTRASARSASTTLGLTPTLVFPDAEATDNALYQEQLLSDFDQGRLLVHFFGHGGRYIWRTGPPDPKKNHDLFTLDHLDRLSPTPRLPVVLSMTCYSAPFDHPTADSIGEKFLRSAGRGAVGVVAASWRNFPTPGFSDALVEHMLRPGATIGEAVLEAKRGERDAVLVQTYNYLGDPATRLKLPGSGLTAELDRRGERVVLRLDAEAAPELAGGRLLIDFLGEDGVPLATIERPLADARAVIDDIPPDALRGAASATVYAWNEARGRDAMVRLSLPQASSEPHAPVSP